MCNGTRASIYAQLQSCLSERFASCAKGTDLDTGDNVFVATNSLVLVVILNSVSMRTTGMRPEYAEIVTALLKNTMFGLTAENAVVWMAFSTLDSMMTSAPSAMVSRPLQKFGSLV